MSTPRARQPMRNPKPRPRPKVLPTPKIVSTSKLPARPVAKRNPELMAFEEEILGTLRVAGEHDAQARVDVGKLLSKVHTKLPHGSWLGWLRTMPFKERTAQNYIYLAQWAEARPGVFKTVAPLGPSKLYTLVRLPDKKLQKLLAKKTHVVPSLGEPRTLERMTFEQFLEVVGNLDRKRAPEPAGKKAAATTLRYTRALSRSVELLLEHKKSIPVEPIREIRTSLRAILTQLDQTFPK